MIYKDMVHMSKRIREIYRKKGIKPPNGKGIHTESFNRMLVGIKALVKEEKPVLGPFTRGHACSLFA